MLHLDMEVNLSRYHHTLALGRRRYIQREARERRDGVRSGSSVLQRLPFLRPILHLGNESKMRMHDENGHAIPSRHRHRLCISNGVEGSDSEETVHKRGSFLALFLCFTVCLSRGTGPSNGPPRRTRPPGPWPCRLVVMLKSHSSLMMVAGRKRARVTPGKGREVYTVP